MFPRDGGAHDPSAHDPNEANRRCNAGSRELFGMLTTFGNDSRNMLDRCRADGRIRRKFIGHIGRAGERKPHYIARQIGRHRLTFALPMRKLCGFKINCLGIVHCS
jgi:hypothetical protein